MAKDKAFSSRLRKRITVQVPAYVQDAFGEPVKTWTTYVVRTAGIKTKQGTEAFSADQRLNKHEVLFTLRYDSKTKDIIEDMRVLYDGKLYDIEAVINYNELNKEIHVYGDYQRT